MSRGSRVRTSGSVLRSFSNRYRAGVAPFAGARIETGEPTVWTVFSNVAPFAGARIETLERRWASYGLRTSPPSRGRGLKPPRASAIPPPARVAPFAGARIETSDHASLSRTAGVAPFAGARIETPTSSAPGIPTRMPSSAPLKGRGVCRQKRMRPNGSSTSSSAPCSRTAGSASDWWTTSRSPVTPLEVASKSVIMTRDTAGAVHVFHNYCRHRGLKILTGAVRRALVERFQSFNIGGHRDRRGVAGRIRDYRLRRRAPLTRVRREHPSFPPADRRAHSDPGPYQRRRKSLRPDGSPPRMRNRVRRVWSMIPFSSASRRARSRSKTDVVGM